MKKILLTAFGLMLMVTLVGCGDDEAQVYEQQPVAQQVVQPVVQQVPVSTQPVIIPQQPIVVRENNGPTVMDYMMLNAVLNSNSGTVHHYQSSRPVVHRTTVVKNININKNVNVSRRTNVSKITRVRSSYSSRPTSFKSSSSFRSSSRSFSRGRGR